MLNSSNNNTLVYFKCWVMQFADSWRQFPWHLLQHIPANGKRIRSWWYLHTKTFFFLWSLFLKLYQIIKVLILGNEPFLDNFSLGCEFSHRLYTVVPPHYHWPSTKNDIAQNIYLLIADGGTEDDLVCPITS